MIFSTELKARIAFSVTLLTCIAGYGQINIMDQFDQGDYCVGLKVERVEDYSRSYENKPRSIQIFIWYPTNSVKVSPLPYSNYTRLSDPTGEKMYVRSTREQELAEIQKEVNELIQKNDGAFDQTKYRQLNTISRAFAQPAKGTFPLILFAPGGNTTNQLHSALCEYLATHGYIVVSIPSLGDEKDEKWPFNQRGLSLQIDDMAAVTNYLKQTHKEVDMGKTGLVAWSVGGVSQAIYSSQNALIKMLISLDSGVGREYGIEMLNESPKFDYKKIQQPFLHFTGKQPETYAVPRSNEFIDSIASETKHSLIIESFAHQHFTSQLGLIPALSSSPVNQKVVDDYVKMSQIVLAFANMHLKDQSAEENGWKGILEEYSAE